MADEESKGRVEPWMRCDHNVPLNLHCACCQMSNDNARRINKLIAAHVPQQASAPKDAAQAPTQNWREDFERLFVHKGEDGDDPPEKWAWTIRGSFPIEVMSWLEASQPSRAGEGWGEGIMISAEGFLNSRRDDKYDCVNSWSLGQVKVMLQFAEDYADSVRRKMRQDSASPQPPEPVWKEELDSVTVASPQPAPAVINLHKLASFMAVRLPDSAHLGSNRDGLKAALYLSLVDYFGLSAPPTEPQPAAAPAPIAATVCANCGKPLRWYEYEDKGRWEHAAFPWSVLCDREMTSGGTTGQATPRTATPASLASQPSQGERERVIPPIPAYITPHRVSADGAYMVGMWGSGRAYWRFRAHDNHWCSEREATAEEISWVAAQGKDGGNNG